MASSSLLNVFLLQLKDSFQSHTEQIKKLVLKSLQERGNEISDHLTYPCRLLLPCPPKSPLHHEQIGDKFGRGTVNMSWQDAVSASITFM